MTYRDTAYRGGALSAFIIDAHTHIGRDYSWGWHQMPEMTTLDAFLRQYDRLGIDCCITAPHPILDGMTTLANEMAAEACAAFPDRIYGYISVAPSEGVEAVRRHIRQYGGNPHFVGFKFLGGYNGSYTQEAYQYALAFASEARCPVLCHTWNNDPSLDELRGMMDAFPGFKLLCAHLGGGSEGMTRRAAPICGEYENFYLELCGSLYSTISLADVRDLVGAEKIIFGTDAINLDPRFDFGRVAFSPLDDAEKDLIFSGNFLRLSQDSQMGRINRA